MPLELFKDRNFSVANIAIATVGFAVTSMSLPLMFFIQLARGLTPTQSALLLIPMAVLSGVLAPFAGKLLDRTDPRFLLVPGLAVRRRSRCSGTRRLMNVDTPIWMFLLPSALMGIGNAGMWGPLATTATRNLPPRQAGAGAGIYNTTRTVGSVIGSASIAAFMQARLEANLPGAGDAHGRLRRGNAARLRRRRLLDRHVAGDPAAGRRDAHRAGGRVLPAPPGGAQGALSIAA